MTPNYTIFVVDDAESARLVLESALRQDYTVESFESAEACLERLARQTPDLFLLDVDLPGMDGFELCRQIHARPGLADVPVIFISGFDDLESRLEGYDAGGIDFVVKPYKLAELRQKVQVVRRISSEQRLLSSQISESSHLTSLILTNLDEYAVLIGFLRSLNECGHYRDLMAQTLEMLRAYRLSGVVQVRLPGTELTLGDNGENYPLEVAVLKHVRTLDRIFEFRHRSAYNFARFTLLVNDMPVHDPELCGRLRDHLAIAAESADAKLQGLQASADSTRAREDITQTLGTLKEAVHAYSEKYERARYRGAEAIQEMLDEMTAAYAYLGLSDGQEEKLQNIVRKKALHLADIYDFGDQTQHTLRELADKLGASLQASVEAAPPPQAEQAPPQAEQASPQKEQAPPLLFSPGVELF